MNSTPQRKEREWDTGETGAVLAPPMLSEHLANRKSLFHHIWERYSSPCFKWDDLVMHFGQTNSPWSLVRIICFFLAHFLIRCRSFCCCFSFKTKSYVLFFCCFFFTKEATDVEESRRFLIVEMICRVSDLSLDVDRGAALTSRRSNTSRLFYVFRGILLLWDVMSSGLFHFRGQMTSFRLNSDSIDCHNSAIHSAVLQEVQGVGGDKHTYVETHLTKRKWI